MTHFKTMPQAAGKKRMKLNSLKAYTDRGVEFILNYSIMRCLI